MFNKKTILITLLITPYSISMNKEKLRKQQKTDARVLYLIKKSKKDIYRSQMYIQPAPTITVHINGVPLEPDYIDKKTKQRLIKSFESQEKYKNAVKNYEEKIQEKQEDK